MICRSPKIYQSRIPPFNFGAANAEIPTLKEGCRLFDTKQFSQELPRLNAAPLSIFRYSCPVTRSRFPKLNFDAMRCGCGRSPSRRPCDGGCVNPLHRRPPDHWRFLISDRPAAAPRGDLARPTFRLPHRPPTVSVVGSVRCGPALRSCLFRRLLSHITPELVGSTPLRPAQSTSERRHANAERPPAPEGHHCSHRGAGQLLPLCV